MSAVRKGPVAMTADEVRELLDVRPTGAVCVCDEDGRLRAVPARAWARDRLVALEFAAHPTSDAIAAGVPACVVVDTFGSYEAIRGVIARGRLAELQGEMVLEVAQLITFSFANAGAASEQRNLGAGSTE